MPTFWRSWLDCLVWRVTRSLLRTSDRSILPWELEFFHFAMQVSKVVITMEGMSSGEDFKNNNKQMNEWMNN